MHLVFIKICTKLKLLNINYMPKRFPEWVNTEVVIKAIKMREEGMLSKQLSLWIESLLEIEKK